MSRAKYKHTFILHHGPSVSLHRRHTSLPGGQALTMCFLAKGGESLLFSLWTQATRKHHVLFPSGIVYTIWYIMVLFDLFFPSTLVTHCCFHKLRVVKLKWTAEFKRTTAQSQRPWFWKCLDKGSQKTPLLDRASIKDVIKVSCTHQKLHLFHNCNKLANLWGGLGSCLKKTAWM